jgi:hypothetical protein
LHEKARLRKDLESWRGRAFTDAELKNFDLEVLIGANCLLNVVQSSKNGSTYANVSAVMPIKKGMDKITPISYTRHVERVAHDQRIPPTEDRDTFEVPDEDSIPF